MRVVMLRESSRTWTLAALALAGLLATVAVACDHPIDSSDEPATEPLLVGYPIKAGNLTIFPVLAAEDRPIDRFLSLEEGLKDGTVEISEIGARAGGQANANRPSEPSTARRSAQQTAAIDVDSDPFSGESPPAAAETSKRAGSAQRVDAAQHLARQNRGKKAERAVQARPVSVRRVGADVNRLVVVNRSDKPLYMMPGEILVGGYQDRTLAQQTIVPADGKPVEVAVFCVEHGRWAARAGRDVQRLAAAFAEMSLSADEAEQLADSASRGSFIGKGGVASKAVRRSAQSEMQQAKVWDEVAKSNIRSGAADEAGAFTANYAQPDVAEKLAEYQKPLAKTVARQRRVIGALVCINGKIESADVFESTPLFQKFWPALLKSYALDASQAPRPKETPEAPTAEAAREFLTAASESAIEKTDNGQGVVIDRRVADGLRSFAVRPQNAEPGAASFHVTAFAE